MHEGMILCTKDGSVFNTVSGKISKKPALVVDMGCGVVLKYGDLADGWLQQYYTTAVMAYLAQGQPDFANDLALVSFDSYEGLSADDVVTLINYMKNCIGSRKMKELLGMEEEPLLIEIKRLQELGF